MTTLSSIKPLSKFLPTDFDPSATVVIIAGKEYYPILMAARIRKLGVSVRLIAFEGETDPELYETFPDNERAMIKVGQLGKFLKALKQFNARYAVLAGQITPRRLFGGLHLDLKALTLLALLRIRNAETIFGLIISEMQKVGVTCLDGRSFLDEDLATKGPMVGKIKVSQDHLEHGIHIAQSIAQLGIGQGVVISKGTVLAVEAFEGTDAMLLRAGSFGAKDMVFVKTINREQDFRVDVPVFGMGTIRTLKKAGIQNVLLESENTIILNKPQVLEAAREADINIVGYDLKK